MSGGNLEIFLKPFFKLEWLKNGWFLKGHDKMIIKMTSRIVLVHYDIILNCIGSSWWHLEFHWFIMIVLSFIVSIWWHLEFHSLILMLIFWVCRIFLVFLVGLFDLSVWDVCLVCLLCLTISLWFACLVSQSGLVCLVSVSGLLGFWSI